MSEIVKEQQTVSSKTRQQAEKGENLYKAIWRWHFYAGIFFAPLIIFLAITGGVYLFKPQIEDYMYHDLYYVQQGETKISPAEQINEVKKNYPNAEITSFTPSFEANRSSVIGIRDYAESVSVYVNPYNGDIIGNLNENDRFMASVKDLHNGELWGGTIGNRLVELAACWTIILIITGVYLWWPRNRKSLFGTLIPRIRLFKGKRMFWRDMHAVTAFWLSLFIVIQVFSGLMWSDVWGSMAHRAVETTGAGSPVGDQPWESYAFPKSTIPTKEVADVPWAAENMPVPESNDIGVTPISVEKVIQTVEDKQVHPGYKIVFPKDNTGVYTVFLDPADVYPNRPRPWTQQTLHIDQYNGKVLADLGWKDYGILGKLISLGIAFHQGEFGLMSQFFMLTLVIGIVMIAVSGFVMWWKRRPEGKLGSPSLPENFKMLKGVGVIVLALSLFFPLVGLSLLVVWVLDWVIIKRIPTLKQWVG
ncbi:PepSY domain-containing protein [Alkalihalobacillus sp. BA299]|uniref:PepSY-associated TM helix domain-containing protein n=1 Tax=Alkalihalobacillus sp. BA299 TaxID=2815938 RepID=UPI001ADA30CD|nr:PepSY domain-containing protein [Alkalihalobacillus sp. BA299]